MDNNDLVVWLKERGHDDAEIAKVLERIGQYDNETMHDAVMDSIGAGTLDLEAFIQEALRETKPGDSGGRRS